VKTSEISFSNQDIIVSSHENASEKLQARHFKLLKCGAEPATGIEGAGDDAKRGMGTTVTFSCSLPKSLHRARRDSRVYLGAGKVLQLTEDLNSHELIRRGKYNEETSTHPHFRPRQCPDTAVGVYDS
jgi:serine/threonine protein phosphatase PrpC